MRMIGFAEALPLGMGVPPWEASLSQRAKKPQRKELRNGVVNPEIPARRAMRSSPYLAYLSRFEPDAGGQQGCRKLARGIDGSPCCSAPLVDDHRFRLARMALR